MTAMADNTKNSPVTRYFFIVLLISGIGLFIFSLFTESQNAFFSGLQQISIGFFLIGTGEWINHPLQKSVRYKDKENFIFRRIHHRKRNPSGLGNLLEICGLILIFTGIATFL